MHNSGANYVGGFTVRDLTNKVIANVDPIGDMGYKDGGNYSTFNWLTVERQGPSDYLLSVLPGQRHGLYRLYNPVTAIKDVGRATVVGTTFDGTTARCDGAAWMAVYNAAGAQVSAANADAVSSLKVLPFGHLHCESIYRRHDSKWCIGYQAYTIEMSCVTAFPRSAALLFSADVICSGVGRSVASRGAWGRRARDRAGVGDDSGIVGVEASAVGDWPYQG